MVDHDRLSGFLNLVKPVGMTSHDAVARVRKLSGCRAVGHAGTLDPEALGVLPLAFGGYTKLLPWTKLTPKTYQGRMVLGTSTTSGDAQGATSARSGPPWPTGDDVARASMWLTGDRIQIPPRVSALKQNGRRLYDLARQGLSVWPDARVIQVESIRVLTGGADRWQFETTVGSGTYIRALVRDWGMILGHSAHLEDLVRTQVGSFSIASAWSLSHLESLGSQWINALETFYPHLDLVAVEVEEPWVALIAHGRRDILSEVVGNAQGTIALTANHAIIAIVSGPPWRFEKVLV